MMEPPSLGIPENPSPGASDSSAELRRVVSVIRTRLPVLIASAVLAGGAVFLWSGQQPKVYEAQTTLIVGQSLSAVNPDYNQLLASQRLSATYAIVATARPLLEKVIRQLAIPETTTELSRRVHAEADVDSTLVTVTAQDGDPARASAIANAIAQELVAVSPAVQGRQADLQQSVDDDLDATQTQIRTTHEQVSQLIALSRRTPEQEQELRTLQAQLISLRSTYAGLLPFSSRSWSNQISVIQPAVAPDTPISPRPLINTMLAAVVALLVAAALAFIAHHLDDTVKDSDDVQEVAALPTLGRIMRFNGERNRSTLHRMARLLSPGSRAIEAYRTLRTNIEFTGVGAPIKSLLVASAVPSEGKTVTAANLAIVFAQAGRRVLLVDANLRRPGVHILFDLPNTQGLTTILNSDGMSFGRIAHETEQKNLRVLTAGPLPSDPNVLLGSRRMRTTVEQFRADHDLVIFDSPPLYAATDAAILGSFLDATVLVVHSGQTRKDAVRRAREALAIAGARVVGGVLNRVPERAYADVYDSDDYYRPDKSPQVLTEQVSLGTQKSAERSGP